MLDAINRRSEGNALFTEELVAALDSGTAVASGELPTSIAQALAARSAAMPRAAGEILRAASAAGRTVSFDVLRAVTALPDDEFADALRCVVRANILEPVHLGEGYRFRHALLQEAIYQETLPGERRRLHASVAKALEEAPNGVIDQADLPALLAHHWYHANVLDRALSASVDAGDLAARRSAHGEALSHFKLASELWSRVPGAHARIRLSRLLQQATREAYLAGAADQAVDFGRRGLDELQVDDDPALRVRLLDDLSLALDAATEEDEAQTILVQLSEIDAEELPARERMMVLDARSRIFRFLQGDHAAAAVAAGEMLGVAGSTGEDSLLAQAQLTMGCSLSDVQAYHEAIERAHLARELAMRARDAELVSRAQRLAYESFWELRSYESAIATARDAREYAARVGLGRSAGPRASFLEADSLRALGRLSESAQVVESALLDEPIGASRLSLHALAAEVSIVRGSIEAAAAHLEAARAPDVTYPRGYFATVRTALAVAERRLDDARAIACETARRLADLRPFSGASEDVWWLAQAGLAAEAEQAEAARATDDQVAVAQVGDAASELLGYLADVRRRRDAEGLPDIGKHRGNELLIAGHVARIEGRDEPGLWIAAAEAFPPSSVEALTARYRQAEAVLATKASRDEIRAVMADAHAVAVEIGARPLAGRFEALARRARIGLRPGTTAVPARTPVEPPLDEPEPAGTAALRKRGLSDREIEVLTLVAAGFSNSDIATSLFISPKTASVHVSHILDKLGVASRTEAATIGVRLGLPEVVRDD